jgi:hypothetical protein
MGSGGVECLPREELTEGELRGDTDDDETWTGSSAVLAALRGLFRLKTLSLLADFEECLEPPESSSLSYRFRSEDFFRVSNADD